MFSRIALLLLLTLTVFVPNELRGEEPDSAAQTVTDRRALLEAGQAAGALPAGMVVRVTADAWKGESVEEKQRAEARGRGNSASQKLKESWEFTTDQVHQLVLEIKNNKVVYRRVKSLPFDSKNLCKQLLDGKILTIEAAEGEGEPMQFVGTDFEFGHRSIDVIVDGKSLIQVGESCAFAGYPESDARAFATLYERLAKQARKAFQEPPVPSESSSEERPSR